MNAFIESIKEAAKKKDKKKDDIACETPGEKIRSGGEGRGLAIGRGRGPLGVPVGEKAMIGEEKDDIACETPGEKIRSGGKGRGLAIGRGRGPLGIPIGEKTAIDLAYEEGVKFALGEYSKAAQAQAPVANANPGRGVGNISAPGLGGKSTTPIANLVPKPTPLKPRLSSNVSQS